MYNMVCVKNSYDANTWYTVADCCNGVTPQKDCDPSLCKNSQACRSKMNGICDSPSMFNDPRCQTWMNVANNADQRQELMSKYCTAESLAAGTCRDFASSPDSHGRMDAAVIRWCTPGKIANPPKVSTKLTQYAKWQIKGAAPPEWFQDDYNNRNLAPWPWVYSGGGSGLTIGMQINDMNTYNQRWEQELQMARVVIPIAEILNPTVTYRDNSKDPICSCINSTLVAELGRGAPPPACFDPACRATGYKTSGDLASSSPCPNWTDCRSTINAIAGGTNKQVNVQQICGGPAIPPTPLPPSLLSNVPTTPLIKDDKQLLLDDEARAAGTTPAVVVPVVATPGLADQLNKPFAPSITGDTSIASVGILFFALVIVSAILWRTWANQRSQNFAERLQAEQRDMLTTQAQAQETAQVQESLQAQVSSMPRVGATA